jgi:UDP-N-acetylglucosamine transferase subunit ALG13
MPEREAEKPEKKPRILLAPLDWGLGHTTRCIPLVREFLLNNCDLWLAVDETQQLILKAEFPTLNYLFLPGYHIQYAKTGRNLGWKILVQLPKIFSTVKRENKWLKEMITQHQFDAVISDNRFGFYSKSIPSVFITHQLQIKTGLGQRADKILQRINYRYINRFTEVWLPDSADEKNLAGELSHPPVKPTIPLHYLGLLSRFENDLHPEITPGHLLIILSGPEPQRSILENIIINEIAHYPGTATVVKGLPATPTQIPSTGMIKFHNHLSSKELKHEIQKADWVISRCGYSTVMDMMRLRKKSILIPTPAQTEQEYLAKHLLTAHLAFCISQKEFSLQQALQMAAQFDFKFFPAGESQLKKIVTEFLCRLSKG